jgi:hypothetical protein
MRRFRMAERCCSSSGDPPDPGVLTKIVSVIELAAARHGHVRLPWRNKGAAAQSLVQRLARMYCPAGRTGMAMRLRRACI